MKYAITVIIISLTSFTNVNAQKMNDQNLNQRLSAIEDKLAIKEVADQFSILADTKDINKQVLLFTENAVVENYSNGKLGGTLTGRKQIGEAFTAYLFNFTTVYHLNGQQTIQLMGDRATTTSYCLVKLIGKFNGQDVNLTHHVIYKDELVKINGNWLIQKRKSDFILTENN